MVDVTVSGLATTILWSNRFRIAAYALAAIVVIPCARADEWSGYAAWEYRIFSEPADSPEQHDGYMSLVLEPRFSAEREDGRQTFAVAPFLRLDQHDPERTHADMRELSWTRSGQGYELRLGVRRVFWGATESQHLVDIINQTDLVEDIDGDEKLGQPMINFALIGGRSTLDLFLLTGFRPRTFPGVEGRPRTPIPVDTGQAVYESNQGRQRWDAAVRWAVSGSGWDLGISRFHGTSRDPQLIVRTNENGTAVLVPYYDVIRQTGVDVQGVSDRWIYKGEMIRRTGQGPTYMAAVIGFEYTIPVLFGEGKELSVLAEYLYDSRGSESPQPFQDDVAIGLRLVFNNAHSTEFLATAILDRKTGAHTTKLEAGHRLTNQWRLLIEARGFGGAQENDPLFPIRHDDYLEVRFARYF